MYKNIYFIGIGGIGMSAIARYYNGKGFKVSGYDKTPSPLTHALEAEGIDVHYTDDISYIPADIERKPAVPIKLWFAAEQNGNFRKAPVQKPNIWLKNL